ncbi:MAG: hypothetical protein U5R31_10675 [Acidimicrobiia bacterium]|nr:hypothetical protein [Acidimicrobiia bacterium]
MAPPAPGDDAVSPAHDQQDAGSDNGDTAPEAPTERWERVDDDVRREATDAVERGGALAEPEFGVHADALAEIEATVGASPRPPLRAAPEGGRDPLREGTLPRRPPTPRADGTGGPRRPRGPRALRAHPLPPRALARRRAASLGGLPAPHQTTEQHRGPRRLLPRPWAGTRRSTSCGPSCARPHPTPRPSPRVASSRRGPGPTAASSTPPSPPSAGGAGTSPSTPRAHHLRRAYALADLYERAGDLPAARQLFERVDHQAPALTDAGRRARALG